MSYIRPNNSTKTYNVNIYPFLTQDGNSAIKFIGEEVPSTYTKGFKYFSDNHKVISDYSEYKYNYAPNIYSVISEIPVPPKPNNTSTNTSFLGYSDPTPAMIKELSDRVNQITPYTETKNVYLHDEECYFDKTKDGVISAYLTIDDNQIPCSYEVTNDKIRVFFEPLTKLGTVTISIQ